MASHIFRALAVGLALGALAWPVRSTGADGQARKPRIAVWDPGTSVEGGRWPVSTGYLNSVATWLADAGIDAQRVTAEQVASPASFGADRFDALMLEGDAVPASDLDAYRRFMDNGGVLIALSATCPFYNRVAQDDHGQWRLSPENPTFSWQTSVINEALGIAFNSPMDMAWTGVRHAATPLLAAYLPQAAGWSLNKPLLARWYVSAGGNIYPLIRSLQSGGGDYTPQLYLIVNGRDHAIVCAGKTFTGEADTNAWPFGRQTVAALARLACDLHAGTVHPDAQQAVSLPKAVVASGPLAARNASAGIDPEHAQAVMRWGHFDGSRLDLGKTLATNATLTLPVGVKNEQVPGALQPGASVTLGLPDLGPGPLYLRIRGAFARTGAGLAARLGDTLLHSERFVYRLSAGTVNISFEYGGAPNEFMRLCFVPPPAAAAHMLVLSNPGSETVFFDAIQVERRTQPARAMGVGLGNGVFLAYDGPTRLTPEICRDWSYFRCASRPWWIGPPDDPARWDRFDKHVERFLALSPHAQLQLEGTPEWAAMSAARYHSAGKSRPQFTPPDNAKYAELVRRIVGKYAGRVQGWEIWNEQNHSTFWMGTPQEFAALCHAVVPVIRELDPKAAIIIGGLAGTVSGYVDQDAAEMVRSGVTRDVDLFGFHPYARNGAWDLPYGLFEGHLMNLGSDIEIYCNESGDHITPADGEPGCSLVEQAARLNRAMARLFADGLAKLTVFNAGGDGDPFGLLDKQAQPRPAYAVFTDYLALARPDGRRLDATLTAADGRPLQGVYVAGASHADGSVTLIVNPADVEELLPSEDPSQDFADKRTVAGWKCFFGKAQYENGRMHVTPGEKGYAGFYKSLAIDPRAWPKVEVSVPECAKTWSLTLKFADGENLVLTNGAAAGVFTIPYLEHLKNSERRDCEVSFRFTGGPAALASVRFLPGGAPSAAFAPLPVHLCLPLPGTGAYAATVRAGGPGQPQEMKVLSDHGQAWAELNLALTTRSVITFRPGDAK